MDNLKDKDGKDIFGFISRKLRNPIGLHVDGGFELNNKLYKQTLIPLSRQGKYSYI